MPSHSPLTRDLNREPNVIPMIDIMLVLLIIFIILSAQKGKLEIVLPQEAEATYEAGPPLVLTVRTGPTYALNGTPIPVDSLTSALRRIYAPRPEKVIFVDGSKDVSYQAVIAAFDAARGAGVTVSAVTPPALALAK
jgi:biopolymer transport protein TolR